MFHRVICAILAALLPLLVVAPAFAQDEGVPFVICGELSEDDCALLEESALAMQELSSFSLGMDLDMTVGGIPDLPVDPMNFGLAMDGSFSLDENAQAVVQQMSAAMLGGSAEDMEELAANMQQMTLDLYGGMDFDMTMRYNVPAELAEVFATDPDMVVPESIGFEIRMIDGIMYMNLSELRALDPAIEQEITSDWIGIDYIGMIEMQMEAAGGMGEDPFANGAMSGLAAMQFMQQVNDFVDVERLDDVALDGQDGAQFAYSFDVVGFFTSDAFKSYMQDIVAVLGEDADTQEIEQAIAMVDFVAPMLFRDLKIESTYVVGLDDKLAYAATGDFSWDLSSVMQFAAMTDPSVAEAMGDAQPMIDMQVDIEYSDQNAEMEMEVPDDVQMIPLEQLVPQDTSAVF
jgi:hypothetical protein